MWTLSRPLLRPSLPTSSITSLDTFESVIPLVWCGIWQESNMDVSGGGGRCECEPLHRRSAVNRTSSIPEYIQTINDSPHPHCSSVSCQYLWQPMYPEELTHLYSDS